MKSDKEWAIYKNGNYMVAINLIDGTKIKKTDDIVFEAGFAENIDLKITNKCADENGNILCPMCHEGSCPSGKHGDILNLEFIDTLHPFQEVAIGGGDATSHPDLIPFLEKFKHRNVIANITVNQIHFMQKQDLIRYLFENKLIHGIGISLVDPTDEFIKAVKQFPTAVIHVINGIFTVTDFRRLANHDLNLLILGYKNLRRGIDYKKQHKERIEILQGWLRREIFKVIPKFKAVAFDNLAIEQLNLETKLHPVYWEKFYMGEEGTSTFYIDAVNREFAQSSTASLDKRYQLLNSVDEMFFQIKSNEL